MHTYEICRVSDDSVVGTVQALSKVSALHKWAKAHRNPSLGFYARVPSW